MNEWMNEWNLRVCLLYYCTAQGRERGKGGNIGLVLDF
jgi:hypothetical protein